MFQFTPIAAALTNAGMRTPAFVQRRIHMSVPIYAGAIRSWLEARR